MLIEQFNKLHPDIPVKMEYLDGATMTCNWRHRPRLVPCRMSPSRRTCSSYPLAKAGISIDMEPLAKADPNFDLNDVYENMLALSKVEGKGIYMIPSSYDVVTMYYNKDLFEKAGVPLPTKDSTWEEIIASCKTIFEKTGAYCIPSNTNGGNAKWWAWYVPWIVGYGGNILSDDGKTAMLNSPETLAGLQAYTDMWTKDGIATPFDFDAGGDCFLVGKCAMMLDIPGLMNGIRALDPQPFEWDVEVIPSFPTGEKVTGMGTYGFSVTANAKDPQLAWDFIKGLLSARYAKSHCPEITRECHCSSHCGMTRTFSHWLAHRITSKPS